MEGIDIPITRMSRGGIIDPDLQIDPDIIYPDLQVYHPELFIQYQLHTFGDEGSRGGLIFQNYFISIHALLYPFPYIHQLFHTVNFKQNKFNHNVIYEHVMVELLHNFYKPDGLYWNSIKTYLTTFR